MSDKIPALATMRVSLSARRALAGISIYRIAFFNPLDPVARPVQVTRLHQGTISMTKKFVAAMMMCAALTLAGCGEAEENAALAAKQDVAKAVNDEANSDPNDPWSKTMAGSSNGNSDQGPGEDANFNVSGGESDNDGNDGGEVAVEDSAPDVVEQGPASNAQQ